MIFCSFRKINTSAIKKNSNKHIIYQLVSRQLHFDGILIVGNWQYAVGNYSFRQLPFGNCQLNVFPTFTA